VKAKVKSKAERKSESETQDTVKSAKSYMKTYFNSGRGINFISVCVQRKKSGIPG